MIGFYFYFLAQEKENAFYSFFSGVAFAAASATRISLSVIGVIAFFHILIVSRLKFRQVLLFVFGALSTAVLVYLPFVIDAKAFDNLINAHLYHASRQGFDLKLILGSLSRIARWYLPVWILICLSFTLPKSKSDSSVKNSNIRFIAFSFIAAAFVHLTSPNPYDDYQVPIMGIAAVYAVVKIAPAKFPLMFFVAVLTLCQTFGSPLLEKFMTNGHDRFWVVPKNTTDVFQLRQVAKKIEAIDPGGKELLTQDLYLAIETNRRVPKGLEMGPFSYWGDVDSTKAGLNKKTMMSLLESAPCKVAAGSGYMFAITVPSCAETDVETQLQFWNALKKRYSLVERIPFFGQNGTTLLLLSRKNEGEP
jgi:hypothetical protein